MNPRLLKKYLNELNAGAANLVSNYNNHHLFWTHISVLFYFQTFYILVNFFTKIRLAFTEILISNS